MKKRNETLKKQKAYEIYEEDAVQERHIHTYEDGFFSHLPARCGRGYQFLNEPLSTMKYRAVVLDNLKRQ